MRHYRPRVIVWLFTFAIPLFCQGDDLFSSPEQRVAFDKALAARDSAYDPAEKMIRRPFSSPGYHTTLKGGYVHPTRDSLQYAVALLDSGDLERCKRAQDILRKVISLQDQDPKSKTYGIWSWFAEEPLDKMSPPDWNWADFCGTQLLQVAIDHTDRLPEDLQQKVKDSIIHAAYSVKRRNVGPGYTNIALMGTYVTITAGDLFGDAELLEYGRTRLRSFWDYTSTHGSFSEYNSPTYTVVAINEITRMLRHIKDSDSRELIEKLNRFAWHHLARRFHPPTRQWSGPHSRCYRTLLDHSSLAFIQRATQGKVAFVPESQAQESLDAHRLRAECPPDFSHYFTDLPAPRLEIETFDKGGAAPHDIIGTTYLHPDFTLGSVNVADLWNQRRPLLAYWNTEAGVVAMRLRCLHDDYDYSSASIFTVQDKRDVLGAVVFATDRGDTHISLDRIKDAAIAAKDLRIRLQFEGPIDNLTITPHPSTTGNPGAQRQPLGASIEHRASSIENNQSSIINRKWLVSSAPLSIEFTIPYAVFDDYPIKFETARKSGEAFIDIILYSGPQRQINFNKISEAAVIFTLSLNPQSKIADPNSKSSIVNSKSILSASWRNLSLTIPTKPMQTTPQRSAASATANNKNPWTSPSPTALNTD